MKFIFLYEIFVALVYMDEMSTPSQLGHGRRRNRGVFEKYFLFPSQLGHGREQNRTPLKQKISLPTEKFCEKAIHVRLTHLLLAIQNRQS